MFASDTLSPQSQGEFCRQARRIRAVWRGDPARTQRALTQLIAARLPQDRPAIPSPPPRAVQFDWTESAILHHGSRSARGFADSAAAQFVAGVLPLDARRALLRKAGRDGIEPFEANLIIAAVQNRLRQSRPRPARRRASPGDGRPSVLRMLWTILLIETAVLVVLSYLI